MVPADGSEASLPLERQVREQFPTVVLDSQATFEPAQELVSGQPISGMRVLPLRTVRLPRSSANRHVPSPGGNDDRGSGNGLRVFYPESYDELFIVELGEQRVVLRPIGAQFAQATTSAGKLIYTSPYASVDVIEVPSNGRSEELLVVHDAKAPRVFEYEIVEMHGVSGLILQNGAIRFSPDHAAVPTLLPGADGRFTSMQPSLQIDRPWVIDANGRRSESTARWTIVDEPDHRQRRIRLTVDADRLAYPIVIDSSFSTAGWLAVPRSNHTATLLPNGTVLIAGGFNGGPASTKAELYDPNTGTFTGTNGPMRTARWVHTATLLRSGKVLITGGHAPLGIQNTAELYDPTSGTFTVTNAAMRSARQSHTATLLSNGKVLIAGGYTGSASLDNAELYDPLDGSFTATSGPMTLPRSSHTATLLANGKVLIAGGSDSNRAELYDPETGMFTALKAAMTIGPQTATLLANGYVLITGSGDPSSAELFDPVSETFTATSGPMTTARADHTATLLPNGKVLIAGGEGGSGYLNTAEVFDPVSGTFTATNMSGPRSQHTATLLPNGNVLLAGSSIGSGANTADLYEPGIGTFTATSGLMTSIRDDPTATLLPNGKVLITAGSWGGNTAELYDPGTTTFTATTTPMTSTRDDHTATLLPDGKVLIAGGSNLNSAELYDPGTGSFSAISPMTLARGGHTATLLPNGNVLIAGGYPYMSDAELYDPGTGKFTPTNAPMTSARAWHTATLLRNGRVLIAGGANLSGYLNAAELYDPDTSTFTAIASMLETRDHHTATLLANGRVLIAGGYSDWFLNTAELYDPDTGRFSATNGLMSSGRAHHTATLLANGKVLVANGNSADIYDPVGETFTVATTQVTLPRNGHAATLLASGKVLITAGFGDSSYLNTAELYDIGLGYQDSWRPIVTSVSTTAAQASTVIATGSRFTGLSNHGPETSGGGTNHSATNYPLLQLRRIDNEETVFLPLDPAAGFSKTSFTSGTDWVLNPGPVLATVFTNGIPSVSTPLSVTCGISITAEPKSQVVAPGRQATFSVTALAASSYQWQKDATASGNWVEIPGATGSTYTTPAISGVDSGSRYRVHVIGCSTLTSQPATLTVADSERPTANVVSPSGGEYWVLSTSGKPPNTKVVAWSMSDNVRVCRVTVSLLYSDNGGSSYTTAPASSTLPAVFGPGGSCGFPGEGTTSLTYTVPATPPSGRSGSLYKIGLVVTDQSGNQTTVESDPFFIVQSNPDSVRTLILTNTARMVSRQGISSAQAMLIDTKLDELAGHPRVQGLVVDLGAVTAIASLYATWDADSANGNKANAVLFGPGGIHEYLRTNLLPAYSGVKYLVLVGDDRIIPMARVRDRTALLPESTYANGVDLSATASTVGSALAADLYLTDDPLAVLDPVSADELHGSLYLPDLAVGRLVETPEEITTTIATYIGQDGILDLTLNTTNKVLVTGYDFLSSTARQMSAQWKGALGVVSTGDGSTSPVDGTLIEGNWGYGSISQRAEALRTKLSGNGFGPFGVMAIAGHATHYEEGVPGTNPFDIQGLSTVDIHGPDSCGTSSRGAISLAGSVLYAVGCHGGLPVPGSCRTDQDHSLDLPQTMMGRGVVALVANTGYGWGLKYGIGYSGRLVQIFTEQLTGGGTVAVGDVVIGSKQRYYLEAPRHDAYDEKTLMQWTLFGLPMYAVKIGTPTVAPGVQTQANESARTERLSRIRVKRSLASPPPMPKRFSGAVRPSASPPSLTQLNLSFDFTANGVYEKHDSSGRQLPSGRGCPDVNGCYYTLNGLVDRGTGSADLPIQPYVIYDSRLSGTSQHGVLWKGGTYDEESDWTPVIAQLVSNGGDGSNHGSAPRKIILRPTAPRVLPGADSPACRSTDLEMSSVTITGGEAVKEQLADPDYSIMRRYRNVDLEVFYFNNRTSPTDNCDRTGPSLGTPPFGGDYHQLIGSTISWAIPASDSSGVWRVIVVYNTNVIDAQQRGTWTPLELTDDGTGTFRGNLKLDVGTRLTYVIEVVDNRGNVAWLDYVSAQQPASGTALGVPKPIDVLPSTDPSTGRRRAVRH